MELCLKVEVVVLGLPVPNSPYGLYEGGPAAGTSPVKVGGVVRAQELCLKVEGAVMGSPSLTVLMVSVDVKHH